MLVCCNKRFWQHMAGPCLTWCMCDWPYMQQCSWQDNEAWLLPKHSTCHAEPSRHAEALTASQTRIVTGSQQHRAQTWLSSLASCRQQSHTLCGKTDPTLLQQVGVPQPVLALLTQQHCYTNNTASPTSLLLQQSCDSHALQNPAASVCQHRLQPCSTQHAGHSGDNW
jgi:hypothetical protein